MKVIVNGVEIEILGGSRLTYDASEDTLTVDLIDTLPAETKNRKYTKKIDEAKAKKQVEIPNRKFTKEGLRSKILEVVNSSEGTVSSMHITLECLGKNSAKRDQTYLRLLMDILVEEGVIIADTSGSRTRYGKP